MAGARIEDMATRFRPAALSNVLLWAVAGFFVLALLWAGFTQLDRTIRGQGRIIPNSRLQVVSNLEGGILEAIFVRPGQLVKRGDLLVRLDRTQAGAEYGSSVATSQALAAKIARLEGEVSGRDPAYPAGDEDMARQVAIERSLHAARMAEIASLEGAAFARLTQAQRSVSEAQSQRAAKAASRDAAIAERDLIRPLVERGIEPRLTLLQADSAAAIARSEAMAASSAISRAQAGVSEARASLNQVRQDWRSRANEELVAARAEAASRTRGLPALESRLSRTVVRAPLSGRINRVLVTTTGGSVKPGDPLVEIVPSGESLLVEAMVNPKDIAFVRLNQRAEVSITAYDPAIYGTLDGRVVAISPDAVPNERTGESFYVLRIRTDRTGLTNGNGRLLPIGPGMVADVSLLGEKRSVLAYILTPISRLSERAFRE